MEVMEGNRWKSRIRQENGRFRAAVKRLGSAATAIGSFKGDIKLENELSSWFIGGVPIIPKGDVYLFHGKLISDIDYSKGHFVYSEDIGNGKGVYKIVGKHWTIQGSALREPGVAIWGDRVYTIETGQKKWFTSVDLFTGRGRRVHYTEEEESVSLYIVRGDNSCLFLLGEDGGRQKLFHVADKVRRLSPEGVVFYPIGEHEGKICYLFRKSFSGPWELRGCACPFPLLDYGIDHVNLGERMIVYRSHGERILYRGSKSERFVGEIEADPWAAWHGRKEEFIVHIPGQFPNRSFADTPLKYAELYRGVARSADGTVVLWCAAARGRPTKLIVIGYGAYGISTPLSTARWKPYIENGFAVGFAFVRGGGDDDDA
jgi:hypothetical protein